MQSPLPLESAPLRNHEIKYLRDVILERSDFTPVKCSECCSSEFSISGDLEGVGGEARGEYRKIHVEVVCEECGHSEDISLRDINLLG